MGYSINEIEAVPAVPAKKVLSVDGKDIATAQHNPARVYKLTDWDLHLGDTLVFVKPSTVDKVFAWLGELISPTKLTRIVFSADLDLAPPGSVWSPDPAGGVTGIYRRAVDGWEYRRSPDSFHGTWCSLRSGPGPFAYPLTLEGSE